MKKQIVILIFLLIDIVEQISCFAKNISFTNAPEQLTSHRLDRTNNYHFKSMNIQHKNPKSDFGQQNIFLQQGQRYILTPGLLFGLQSSFKKQYQIQPFINGLPVAQMKQSKFSKNELQQQQEFFEIHPALEEIISYDLTDFNLQDCLLMKVFISDYNQKQIACMRKSLKMSMFQIHYDKVYFDYEYSIENLWSNMLVVSLDSVLFYNSSFIEFIKYERQTKVTTISKLALNSTFRIEQCQTYGEYVSYGFQKYKSPENNIQTANQLSQNLFLVCYTNNNRIQKLQKGNITFQNVNLSEQVKKDYIMTFSIKQSEITLLNYFEIPQRNASTINHIIGFDIIDNVQKMILLCYNLYKITPTVFLDSNRINSSVSEDDDDSTLFSSSFCSIFKIYQQKSQMVLINRLQLQSSPYPLLTSICSSKSMLAVTTQVSLTFYQLDILKQMFQFVQKIAVPTVDQNFNCYQFSQLQSSLDSLSFSCSSGKQQDKIVAFVMVYNQDLKKYVPVGNIFVDKFFFHVDKVIYVIDNRKLSVLYSNQEYVIFDYLSNRTIVKISEILIGTQQKYEQNFATIVINPAQYGKAYADEQLPLIYDLDYDIEDQLELKGAFQGSNISYVKVQIINDSSVNQTNQDNAKKNQILNDIFPNSFLKQDKIYSYEYSLLLSVYIRQQCIRIIKYSDTQFYRILRIQKSRVDSINEPLSDFNSNQNVQVLLQNNLNTLMDEEEYYYYTEMCTKIKNSYVCQLSQINQIPSYNNAKSIFQGNEKTRIKNHVLDIDYIEESDTFVYLYEIKNLNFRQKYLQKNYALMFLNMQKDGNQTNQSFFQLKDFFIPMFKNFESKEKSNLMLNFKEVTLRKGVLSLQIEYRTKALKAFCPINIILTLLKKPNQQTNQLNLKKICLLLNLTENMKFYIQQNKIIVSELQIQQKTSKTFKKITVYDVIKNQYILKEGEYRLEHDDIKDSTQKALNQEEQQFVGQYRQYIIIVNTTTITKYHIATRLEPVYQFTFNPDFVQQHQSNQNKSSPYHIKYVLFLEKYLIIQYDYFYQLFDISQQLISIQISANNFVQWYQDLNPKQRYDFKISQQVAQKSTQLSKNIIINDAFLVQGDNIVIYEQGQLVVAKYITNPTLSLGPFDQNHQLVQQNIQIRITPVLDTFNSQNTLIPSQDETHQDVMIRIFYSHYMVEKIAKNIKTLTVPSVTQNYQLEIWTHVFRGNILEYYLSDTFDGQIVLRQHITKIRQEFYDLTDQIYQENSYILIPHHHPFKSKYSIKWNLTHIKIESIGQKTIQYVEISSNIKEEYFIKYLLIENITDSNKDFICLLGLKNIVFLEMNNQSIYLDEPILPETRSIIKFQHNITISVSEESPIPQKIQIELLKDKYFNTSDRAFSLIIWTQNQQQENPSGQKIITSTNIHAYAFLYNGSSNYLSLIKTEKIKISEQILSIRSLYNCKSQSDGLLVLTYMQNLIFYDVSIDNVVYPTNNQNLSILKLKQLLSLPNLIPSQYRINIQKYVKIQLIPQEQKCSQQLAKILKSNPINRTMLIFSQGQKAFHIQFNLYEIQNQNQSQHSVYKLEIQNIYSGYPNFQLKEVVFIQESSFSRNNDQPFPSYTYFILEYEYETSQQTFIVYYPYNFNYSQNKQVGYFKCGQKISSDIIGSDKDRQNHTKPNKSSKKDDQSNDGLYYLFFIGQYGIITAQTIKITLPNNLTSDYSISNSRFLIHLQSDKTFEVNQTIYMLLNYQKPPVVSYILLNARNFNIRSGIYTKFIFLKTQMTWLPFYIGLPVVLVLFVLFALWLKRHQPNSNLNMKKENSQTSQFIFSRSSSENSQNSQKQEKIICIEEIDQDQTSNYRSSFNEGEGNISPRFGYMSPDRIIKNKQSSLIQSPFRTYYQGDHEEQIQQSDIEEVPQIKLKYEKSIHQDHEEEKQILSYLISKKSSFASNTSDFH